MERSNFFTRAYEIKNILFIYIFIKFICINVLPDAQRD